jgi:hypothetical protein
MTPPFVVRECRDEECPYYNGIIDDDAENCATEISEMYPTTSAEQFIEFVEDLISKNERRWFEEGRAEKWVAIIVFQEPLFFDTYESALLYILKNIRDRSAIRQVGVRHMMPLK